MSRRRSSIAALGLLAAVWTSPATACRFNVRDVGFVDFESESFTLYGFVDRSVSEAVSRRFLEDAEIELKSSNIAFERVDLDSPSPHPAHEFRNQVGTRTLPTAVLVASGVTALPVEFQHRASGGPPDFRAAIRALVSSPTREALALSCARSFGTVLLIEGTDAEANRHARRTVLDAIEQVEGHMKSLPKAIAEPPSLEIVPVSALVREGVLLHLLRLDTRPVTHPRAAVFYGRGRWIGPIMNADEISARNIVGLFSIIGADCECGHDLAWTLGTRLPLEWSESLHERATKGLGFDPENPLVKMEITTLVNRRGTVRPETPRPIQPATDPIAPSIPAPDVVATTASPTASVVTSGPSANSPQGSRSGSTWVWKTLIGAGGAIVIAAGLLLRRASKRGQLD